MAFNYVEYFCIPALSQLKVWMESKKNLTTLM